MKNILIAVFYVFPLVLSAQNKSFPILELNYPDSLNIVKRSEWGWLPLTDTIEQQQNIKYLTVHHGGVEFYDQEKAAQKVKNLQIWGRREKNWIDIPYHFMIDLNGNVYEARPVNYPGDTNTEYNTAGHLLVELMGNYEIQEVNENQLNSLTNLLLYLAREFDIPVQNIKTHKDYSDMTSCPGKNLYKYFTEGTIVRMVKKKMSK